MVRHTRNINSHIKGLGVSVISGRYHGLNVIYNFGEISMHAQHEPLYACSLILKSTFVLASEIEMVVVVGFWCQVSGSILA